MSLTLERKNGILYVNFNTLGSAVNILDNATATQVEQAMLSIEKEPVEAVVFQSSKSGSFINGVGLLLASAVHTPEDALKLTAGIRRAYQSVKAAKVPTFAAIQGNCYGCGVEFVLNCDYRLVANTVDSHFYMTEIHDYLFIPAFGATQNLPRLVGLNKAVDFLLWGEKWSSQVAKRNGLVDDVFNDSEFQVNVDSFVQKAIKAKKELKKRKQRRVLLTPSQTKSLLQKNEKRIVALPPAYHEVYRDCFNLMKSASVKSQIQESDYHLELACAGKSVMNPISKAALSFFFIRQSVQGICLRGEQNEATQWKVLFSNDSSRLLLLQRDLKRRKMRGAKIDLISSLNVRSQGDPGTSIFHLYVKTPKIKDKYAYVIRFGDLQEWENTKSASVNLYNPLYPSKQDLVEIALEGEATESTRALFRYLSNAGFRTIVTRPQNQYAINRLLVAYVTPLLMYCARGGSPENVDFSLREFGFCRRLSSILKNFDSSQLTKLLLSHSPVVKKSIPIGKVTQQLNKLAQADYRKGRFELGIIDAMTISLLAAIQRCFKDRTVTHPAVIDLIARELLDFPLLHGSLCKYLFRQRIQEALGRSKQFSSWVSSEDLVLAKQFSAQEKEFYL